MKFELTARTIVAFVAVLDIAMFCEPSLLVLLGAGVGLAAIIVGIVYGFRPSAIVGLLIVSVVAGASIQVPTLTETGFLVMAIVGLLLPMIALFWLSFSVRRLPVPPPSFRPALVGGAYAIASICSAPVFVSAVAFFQPHLSAGLASMAESAIILLSATVAGSVLLWRGSRHNRPSGEEE